MNTHLDTDPWASTDHNPTSTGGPTIHRTHITTGHALMLARADLHAGLAHHADLRRQYAPPTSNATTPTADTSLAWLWSADYVRFKTPQLLGVHVPIHHQP